MFGRTNIRPVKNGLNGPYGLCGRKARLNLIVVISVAPYLIDKGEQAYRAFLDQEKGIHKT